MFRPHPIKALSSAVGSVLASIQARIVSVSTEITTKRSFQLGDVVSLDTPNGKGHIFAVIKLFPNGFVRLNQLSKRTFKLVAKKTVIVDPQLCELMAKNIQDAYYLANTTATVQ